MFPKELFELESLSLIGTYKNAGKTTVLNAILEEARKKRINRKIAITSIGRDGEQKDLVTSTKKPKIYVSEGTIVATAKKFVNKSDITKEILASTDITTSVGKIVLYRALSSGYCEIAGPSSVEDCRRIREIIKNIDKNALYIVDGALSRKSTAGHFLTQASILATGAALDNSFEKVINNTIHQYNLFMIEKADKDIIKTKLEKDITIIGDKNISIDTLVAFSNAKLISNQINETTKAIVIKGAITQKFLNDLISENDLRDITIVAEDATRFMIDSFLYSKLNIMGVKLRVLEKTKLIAITINPFSPTGMVFDSLEFENAIKKEVDIPVIDVLRRENDI